MRNLEIFLKDHR